MNRQIRATSAVVALATFVAIAILGGWSVASNLRTLARRSAIIDYQSALAERQECRDVEETAAEVAIDDIVLLAVAEGDPDPAAFADASTRLQAARDRLGRINDPDVCGPLPRKPDDD